MFATTVLVYALIAGAQSADWKRVRIGTTPLSLESSAEFKALEDDGGLSVYSRNSTGKAWQTSIGELEFTVQVWKMGLEGPFEPYRAIASAEALNKSIHGERLNAANISKASTLEGGMQIEELMIAVVDRDDPKKKVGHGYWAAWDGEWGCMARYSFPEKDLETAMRLVSSRKFVDTATGLYRFQTGLPGLRFLAGAPFGAGEETNLHNAAWFESETTYESKFDGITLRFSQLRVKDGTKADIALAEKAMKWQADAQAKLPDVKNLVTKVDRAPLAGQTVARLSSTYTSKGVAREALVYGIAFNDEVWSLVALRNKDDAKAAETIEKLWQNAKVIEPPKD